MLLSWTWMRWWPTNNRRYRFRCRCYIVMSCWTWMTPMLRPGSRIIGGSTSHPHQWPFMASIQYHDGYHFCGGTLIAAKWVLTAAHCTEGFVWVNVFFLKAYDGRRTPSDGKSSYGPPGTPVSPTNKTDCHDTAEILLKVALNTIIIAPSCWSCWIDSVYSACAGRTKELFNQLLQ
jgi:hypothetical protein